MPVKKQIAAGTKEVADKAIKDLITALGHKFGKYLTAANPKDNLEFLLEVMWTLRTSNPLGFEETNCGPVAEVNKHFDKHEKKTEMTPEKLQIVATTAVDAKVKVRRLKMWNGSAKRQKDLWFSKSPCSENELEPFLHKATWWARISSRPYFALVLYWRMIVFSLSSNFVE